MADPNQAPTPNSRDDALKVSRLLPETDHAPGSTRTTPEQQERALGFAMLACQLLRDDKCEHVLLLDLRGRSQVTDFFVVASGSSQRQMRSAGQHVAALAKEYGLPVVKDNLGDRDSDWFVIDSVDVVAHLFEPETRVFYDLEMLWGDAPRIDWRREDQKQTASFADGGDRNLAGVDPEDIPPPPEEG